MTLSSTIADLKPCREACEYLDTHTDWQTAWDNCPRADWMLWLLGRVATTDRKQLVRAACAIARTALKYVPDGELRPLTAIETAERWTEDQATIAEVRASASAAAAAYAAAASASAAAAYAAYAAASVASAAAASAASAAYAAYADSASAAAAARKEHAATLRTFFPQPPLIVMK